MEQYRDEYVYIVVYKALESLVVCIAGVRIHSQRTHICWRKMKDIDREDDVLFVEVCNLPIKARFYNKQIVSKKLRNLPD